MRQGIYMEKWSGKTNSRGEMIAMVALSLTGAGLYSLDHLLSVRLPEPATWAVMAFLVVVGVLSALFGQSLRSVSPREAVAS